MRTSRLLLLAGGLVSAAVAVVHVALAIRPDWWTLVMGSASSPLGALAAEGPLGVRVVTAALALVFATWALYAASGAELVRPLPLLRPALVVIGVVYLLRGLAILAEIDMVRTQGYPPRFILYSTISLAAGLLYLAGVWRRGGGVSSMRFGH